MSNRNFPKIPKIALRKACDECKHAKNAFVEFLNTFFTDLVWFTYSQYRVPENEISDFPRSHQLQIDRKKISDRVREKKFFLDTIDVRRMDWNRLEMLKITLKAKTVRCSDFFEKFLGFRSISESLQICQRYTGKDVFLIANPCSLGSRTI